MAVHAHGRHMDDALEAGDGRSGTGQQLGRIDMDLGVDVVCDPGHAEGSGDVEDIIDVPAGGMDGLGVVYLVFKDLTSKGLQVVCAAIGAGDDLYPDVFCQEFVDKVPAVEAGGAGNEDRLIFWERIFHGIPGSSCAGRWGECGGVSGDLAWTRHPIAGCRYGNGSAVLVF